MCTGKALVVPAHKSAFTAAEKGRKGGTEDEARDRDITPVVLGAVY